MNLLTCKSLNMIFLIYFFRLKMCFSFIDFDCFNVQYLDENTLRSTTLDEKGLVLIVIFFNLIF
jgi:hypothetical protein